MGLVIYRLLRDLPLMDLFGEPLTDGGIALTLWPMLKNAVRSVPSDQMDELLLHGTAIALALKAPGDDGCIRLAQADHDWLLKTLKAKPLFTGAVAQDALLRALNSYTEFSADSAKEVP